MGIPLHPFSGILDPASGGSSFLWTVDIMMFLKEFCRWNSWACFKGGGRCWGREFNFAFLCLFSPLLVLMIVMFLRKGFTWDGNGVVKGKKKKAFWSLPLLSWALVWFGSLCCRKQFPVHVPPCAWITKETQSDLPTSMSRGGASWFQQDGWLGRIQKWHWGLGSLSVMGESSWCFEMSFGGLYN